MADLKTTVPDVQLAITAYTLVMAAKEEGEERLVPTDVPAVDEAMA